MIIELKEVLQLSYLVVYYYMISIGFDATIDELTIIVNNV